MRNDEPASEVAFAPAEHRRVDREHKGAEPLLLRIAGDFRSETRVPWDVELEPAGDACRRDLVPTRGGERRNAHDRSRRRGGAGHRHLAVGVCHALVGDRRNEKRKGNLLPEHGRRRRRVGDVDEYAGPEVPAAVGGDIVRQSQLVVRAAREVPEGPGFEQVSGQPLVVPHVERLHRLRMIRSGATGPAL